MRSMRFHHFLLSLFPPREGQGDGEAKQGEVPTAKDHAKDTKDTGMAGQEEKGEGEGGEGAGAEGEEEGDGGGETVYLPAGDNSDFRLFRAKLRAGSDEKWKEQLKRNVNVGQLAGQDAWAHEISAPEKGCLIVAKSTEFSMAQTYFNEVSSRPSPKSRNPYSRFLNS